MSLEAVGLAWEGYSKSMRESWEQTRIMTYYLAAPYFKEEQTMKQFMPLDWDGEKQPEKKDTKQPDKERFNELIIILNLN